MSSLRGLLRAARRARATAVTAANVIFGDPSAETSEDNPLSRLLALLTDASVALTLAVTLALMLGWCVPSTYIFKRKYLRYIAHSKIVSRVERVLPYVFVWMVYLWIRELRRTAPLTARLAALTSQRHRTSHSPSGPRAAEGAGRTSHDLVHNVRRKYRAGFAAWCGRRSPLPAPPLCDCCCFVAAAPIAASRCSSVARTTSCAATPRC